MPGPGGPKTAQVQPHLTAKEAEKVLLKLFSRKRVEEIKTVHGDETLIKLARLLEGQKAPLTEAVRVRVAGSIRQWAEELSREADVLVKQLNAQPDDERVKAAFLRAELGAAALLRLAETFAEAPKDK